MQLIDGVLSVALTLAVTSSTPVPREGEDKHNVTLIRRIVQEEIAAAKLANAEAVCLALPSGRDPERRIVDALKRAGVRIRKGSWCYKRPQGILIAIEQIDREMDHAQVAVETSDLNLDGAHVGTQLRKGIYSTQATPEGEWRVVGYRSTIAPP